jgi:predicted transcriptional regulator
MTTRRQTANEDTLFWTMKLLQDNPGMTQRGLAKEVGINVSSINFCLKALVEKGWIKMGNFSRNPDKLH